MSFSCRRIPELFAGMGPGHELELGTLLLEEEFDDLAVVVHLGLEGFDHPLPGKPGIVEVDSPAHQEKGCQRTDDGQQDETAEKAAIVSFSLDIELAVIDGIIARHSFFLIESTAASPKAACPAGRRLGGGIETGKDKKLKVMRHMSLALTIIVIKKHARTAESSLADRKRRNYGFSHFPARGPLPGRTGPV